MDSLHDDEVVIAVGGSRCDAAEDAVLRGESGCAEAHEEAIGMQGSAPGHQGSPAFGDASEAVLVEAVLALPLPRGLVGS